jgi:hypothetical protein
MTYLDNSAFLEEQINRFRRRRKYLLDPQFQELCRQLQDSLREHEDKEKVNWGRDGF